MTTTSNTPEDEVTIPEDLRSDLDMILGMLSTIALDLIKEEGNFYPFGGYLTTDGQLQVVCGKTATSLAGPEEVLEANLEELRTLIEESNDVPAVGVVKSVFSERSGPGGAIPTSAMAIEMEHRCGWASTTFVPYFLDDEGELEGTGDRWVCKSKPRVFSEKDIER